MKQVEGLPGRDRNANGVQLGHHVLMRRRRDIYQRMSPSQRAGIVAASGSVPMSLVPLIRPRSATDQGLITGLSSAINYAVTALAHDVVMGTSRGVLRLARVPVDARSTARTTLAFDLAAFAVSSAVHAALPRREGERLTRALVRTGALRIRAASLAGAVPGVLDVMPGRDSSVGAALRSVPGMVVIGAGVSAAVQRTRVERLHAAGADLASDRLAPLAKSLGAGAVTAAGAVAFASVERRIARVADQAIQRATGTAGQGSTASHLLSIAAISGGLYCAVVRAVRRIETTVTAPDGPLATPPTSQMVSGCPGSAVSWDSLGREARRHLVSATPAAAIESVMGEPASEPIRLYVGLNSAATDADRVALALAELERTGALDRRLLVLCSPTGSGYVNYTAASAWEYLSRGSCASLTLQYAQRPSMLSIDRVDEGRHLNQTMVAGLAAVLGARPPERRPHVALFGESLGAFTSQDTFLHTGTRGLRAHFIGSALWLGTPPASGWALEIDKPGRADVRPGEALRAASADELEQLDPEAAAVARYILLSHLDDGVTQFSPWLLARCPSWLAENRSPVVAPQASWSTPITFLQSGIDAKNSAVTTPGQFTTSGHDYRGDLARAVRFTFGLKCSDDQVAAVEAALRREDVERSAAWS
jgi:uncharacterized membrane protein